MAPFTITSSTNTDIWRKPPTTEVYNAPTHAPTTKHISLSTFRSATATFRANWTQRYDQAGILLALRPSSAPGTETAIPPHWIKTGVEFYQGKPHLSVVATDRYSDWSICPIPSPSENVTVRVEKGVDELGDSLWVYYVPAEGEKVPLREICWVYGLEGGWDVEVAAFACRPAGTGGDLEVLFEEFVVE